MNIAASIGFALMYLAGMAALIFPPVYLYYRQGATGRNRIKIDELNELYKAKYQFKFKWPRLCAQLLPNTEPDEEEAIAIAESYFVERGQFRRDAIYLNMYFNDALGNLLFEVTGRFDNSQLHLLLVRSKGHAFWETNYEILKHKAFGQGGA